MYFINLLVKSTQSELLTIYQTKHLKTKLKIPLMKEPVTSTFTSFMKTLNFFRE